MRSKDFLIEVNNIPQTDTLVIADCELMKGAGYKAQGTGQDNTNFSPYALSLEPYASLAIGY
jgi:hypothetical protein